MPIDEVVFFWRCLESKGFHHCRPILLPPMAYLLVRDPISADSRHAFDVFQSLGKERCRAVQRYRYKAIQQLAPAPTQNSADKYISLLTIPDAVVTDSTLQVSDENYAGIPAVSVPLVISNIAGIDKTKVIRITQRDVVRNNGPRLNSSRCKIRTRNTAGMMRAAFNCVPVAVVTTIGIRKIVCDP